ncbi:MAG TPA: FAD-dependent oxidoreductase [Acidimicrobiales bacterium]|nr:FAD-dependent oxidoreductase [Acidimicrobiales bacterium]
MTERRIGVYVCHCGGNISDYVDVQAVIDAVKDEADVVVAKDAMFTCSDLTQQEIISDIGERSLDGLVVASCSPKLHTFTFREMARRAGLNPYEYTQVNLREQCSWTHTDDPAGATRKAVRLVRAGIAATRESAPLEPTTVETTQSVLVVGGGVAGMRAAIGLADIGLEVFVAEREQSLGGRVGDLGPMFPHATKGSELIERMREEIARRPSITVLTRAEVLEKSGTYGNYRVAVRTPAGRIGLDVGQIVVATGFADYLPGEGELGYGAPGVVTLPELVRMLNACDGTLSFQGKPVNSLAYIYCVGSRDAAHPHCSKYCCNAAVHTSLRVAEHNPAARQYHLYRDMRTYGRNEEMLTQSRKRGSVYLKFADDAPPEVDHKGGRLTVKVRDLLTANEDLSVPVDLVVLVTGMAPRENVQLVRALKLPVGRDGFFNEIHPKLRPVETVVDGVIICGTCQGPKTAAESVASGMAAVTQVGAVLKRAVAELDPQVATVKPVACTGCAACLEACPFGAISLFKEAEAQLARVDAAGCKGCGACVPVCATDAIDLAGYTDARARGVIDALLAEVAR